MDVLLDWVPLALHLTCVALLKDSVHLRHQPEHVDLFPTEVRGGGDAGMSQELVGGLYDPVVQAVGNVKALARDSLFLGLQTTETGRRILM